MRRRGRHYQYIGGRQFVGDGQVATFLFRASFEQRRVEFSRRDADRGPAANCFVSRVLPKTTLQVSDDLLRRTKRTLCV